MINKVVARFKDGTIEKGSVNNFNPRNPTFHLHPAEGGAGREIQVEQLKAIFFVKDLIGNPAYNEKKDIPVNASPALGRRVRVRFKDGETLTGFSNTYQKGAPGFFLFPADEATNNQRIFVVASATEAVETL